MPEKNIRLKEDETVEDIILSQRKQNVNNNADNNSKASKQILPAEITRK